MTLTRIHLHWTGGGYKPNKTDLAPYHFLIDGDGKTHRGDLPPEANAAGSTRRAPHTLNANTGAIGVAICAMGAANEKPFRWGFAPMKWVQIDQMCDLVARLAIKYRIPCTRRTILTHAEVGPALGIKQNGKWDITVLPGNAIPGEPVDIGDLLRERIKKRMVALQ